MNGPCGTTQQPSEKEVEITFTAPYRVHTVRGKGGRSESGMYSRLLENTVESARRAVVRIGRIHLGSAHKIQVEVGKQSRGL